MIRILLAFAAMQSPLDLSTVQASAERAYPPLMSADVDVQVAASQALTAVGGFDAALRMRASTTPLGYYRQTKFDSSVEQATPFWGATVFGGYRMGQGDFAIYDGKQATNEGGEVRAGASLPVWRNGPIDRRRATMTQAESVMDATRAAYALARLDAIRFASIRYWDWVAAGRRVSIARTLLDTARARERGLADAIRLGNLPAIERAENDRAVLMRQAGLVSAERSLQQAAIELSLFVRGPDGAPEQPVSSRLPVLPAAPSIADLPADDVGAALNRRPEIARLRALEAQARVELAFAQNQASPAVDFTIVGSQDLGAGSPTRSPAELETGIFIELPIQNNRGRGQIDAAAASLTRLSLQARFAAERAAADIQDARAARTAAQARAAFAQQEQRVAERLEKAERGRFQLGEGTLFVVNMREQATAEAALREVDARADYHRAVAIHLAALGLPLIP